MAVLDLRSPSWLAVGHAGYAGHVAISDDIVRCDVAQGVSLDEGALDVAVFSLSLMGANTGDYLRVAARTLAFDARLIVCEATSRLPDEATIQEWLEWLERLGFHATEITTVWSIHFHQSPPHRHRTRPRRLPHRSLEGVCELQPENLP